MALKFIIRDIDHHYYLSNLDLYVAPFLPHTSSLKGCSSSLMAIMSFFITSPTPIIPK